LFAELEPALQALAGFEPPWYIAGGWALDLFLGRQTREHKDVDVCILRRDQLALQRHLAGWRFEKVVAAPTSHWRIPWLSGERLELPVHEVHAFAPDGLEFELLLNESDGSDWVYRRNPAVRCPLAAIGSRTRAGVPFLCPENVLLHKTKNTTARDDADLALVLPRLDPAARSWLAAALRVCMPDHPWLASLES
jgi:hypothetical protein